MKKLTILLFCLLCFFVTPAQEKKDTLALQKQYLTACYQDSTLVNCYVLLITDGKAHRYDTICGQNWIVFNVAGTLPEALNYKFQTWFHKQPSWKEFVRYVELHK